MSQREGRGTAYRIPLCIIVTLITVASCAPRKDAKDTPRANAQLTGSKDHRDSRSRKLAQTKFDADLTKESFLNDWGPPDRVEGSGVQYLVYRLDDERWLWVWFAVDGTERLLTAHITDANRPPIIELFDRFKKSHGENQALGSQDARKALEELRAKPSKDVSHPDWLPPLMNEDIHQLTAGEIRIGRWHCDLNKKTFHVSVEFPRAPRHRINFWSGVFERTPKGEWCARITDSSSPD